MEMSAELVPMKAVREGSAPGLCPWLIDATYPVSSCPPSTCLSGSNFPLFIRKPVMDKGSTLMTSL